MNCNSIRKSFLDFFSNKKHQIVSSAPMVIKNDPTLMFTNAGMNQFKDIFLGNSPAKFRRIADTQKCLRVSGKHNDLEEVGIDTYHHTMFEMLGNWSFGDYFKKEAIDWAWEYLTETVKLDKSRLYATYFGGSDEDAMEPDYEALELWKKYLPEDRIIPGSKKDNFWEMGETGPCGPCSEIHIDLRDDDEIKKLHGNKVVNTGNPEVIEIWNLVFIQFNRMNDGKLTALPDKHVDTGMGFERLCRVIQGKKSNYDSDIFQPIINEIEKISGLSYAVNEKTDIAMRVISDHIRAISFAIADGQLPSNNKAGYVIRRILRRAVRYGYTYLGLKEPFLCKLIPILSKTMGEQFHELVKQHDLIEKVIREEEVSFIKTLSSGIQRFEMHISQGTRLIDGSFAFELFDTYGFPIDLTQLMAREKNIEVDMIGFEKCMTEQKERSRNAASVQTDDWVEIIGHSKTAFVGYDLLECDAAILKFRKVKSKNQELFQIVLDKTPFYAESGGQLGDCGWLVSEKESIEIINTIKENDLIIHLSKKIPADLSEHFTARIDFSKRKATQNNHSATHLLHEALRSILGNHVEQKGSMVSYERLRFDFSHFAKLTEEEIKKVEEFVNSKIDYNIELEEFRNIPVAKAQGMGAIALFGEKYGDEVRVIKFGDSVELCGGTHVCNTSAIKTFRIVSEGAIAAGVRRIEALTGNSAIEYYRIKEAELEKISELLKHPKDISKSIENLIENNHLLTKQIEQFTAEKVQQLKNELSEKKQLINNITCIIEKVNEDATLLRDLAFKVKAEYENAFICLAGSQGTKAGVVVVVPENLNKEKGLNAGSIIKELAKEINGGGGGQPHFASAGGTNPEGIETLLKKAKEKIIGL